MEELNLNIQDYTLSELLNLFGLTKDIKEEGIINARRKTLMMHPDKSRLPPDYFNFYREAYEIVLKYYIETIKTRQVIPDENPEYVSLEDVNPSSFVAPKMNKRFISRFNRIFETVAVDKEKIEKQQQRYEWFSKDESPEGLEKTPVVKNAKDIHNVFDNIRKNTQQQGVIMYQGVRPLTTCSYAGDYYEDVKDTTETEYIASDTFSKLKYDDIRRVHKDQVIMPSVSVEKRPETIERYLQERECIDLSPMEKHKAESLLSQNEIASKEKWANLYELSQQKIKENESKNKNVLSSFLFIKDR